MNLEKYERIKKKIETAGVLVKTIDAQKKYRERLSKYDSAQDTYFLIKFRVNDTVYDVPVPRGVQKNIIALLSTYYKARIEVNENDLLDICELEDD